jgi:hypothetical protein
MAKADMDLKNAIAKIITIRNLLGSKKSWIFFMMIVRV